MLNAIMLLLLGAVAGSLSGLVGIGGGVVIVPALVYLFAYAQHKAQGTSLGVLVFPVVLLAVINYARKGNVDFVAVLFIALGFVAGSFLGSNLAHSLPELTLKRIFGTAIVIVGLRMILSR